MSSPAASSDKGLNKDPQELRVRDAQLECPDDLDLRTILGTETGRSY